MARFLCLAVLIVLLFADWTSASVNLKAWTDDNFHGDKWDPPGSDFNGGRCVDVPAEFNDRITSLSLVGCHLFWQFEGCNGRSINMKLDGDWKNLKSVKFSDTEDWNDRISSVRLVNCADK